MASYLVTGAARGLGFEFIRQLSADGENTVFGLVRNKAATDEQVKKEIGSRPNIHIVQADITDYDALKKSSEIVANVTGGKLDYVIANAALQSETSAYAGIGDFAGTPDVLEKDMLDSFRVNALGNVHLFNIYLPLLLKGNAKKAIAISSGMADIEFVNEFDIANGAPYTMTKAAMNAAIAKFNAQYKSQGVLFLSISPGMVNTGPNAKADATEEEKKGLELMISKFSKYAPDWKGPITATESAERVLGVIHKASLEDGYGGAFISHYGNKQWL